MAKVTEGPTDEIPERCEECNRKLRLEPTLAGAHPAVRLVCPKHGAVLMWTPFGDDATS